MTALRRFPLHLALACAALAVTAACGPADDGLDRSDALRGYMLDAATATEQVATARVEIEIAGIPADAPGDYANTHMTGVYDFVGEVGRFRVELPGEAGGTDVMTMLIAGDVVYVTAPHLRGMLPGGASWIRVPGSAEEIAGVGEIQPSAMARWLRGVTGSVERSGRERLHGVPTERFAVEVDVHDAGRVFVDPDEGERSADAYEAATGTDVIPGTVWIDRAGRVRKLEMRLANGVRSATELWDLGVDVRVRAPRASAVVDEAELRAAPSAS